MGRRAARDRPRVPGNVGPVYTIGQSSGKDLSYPATKIGVPGIGPSFALRMTVEVILGLCVKRVDSSFRSALLGTVN